MRQLHKGDTSYKESVIIIWVKVFKDETSKICGRQPLKNFAWSFLEYLDAFNNYKK